MTMTNPAADAREALAGWAREHGPTRIASRALLVALAKQLDVQRDWHEPDEQGLTARVEGTDFDNTGTWPASMFPGAGTVEQHVVLSYADPDDPDAQPVDVAAINLADLLGWAALKR